MKPCRSLTGRDAKPLNWFQVSDATTEGRDLKFVNAVARIVGNDTVEVSSPDVPAPKSIRFPWHCEARHNLIDKEGLPAVSFWTDSEAK